MHIRYLSLDGMRYIKYLSDRRMRLKEGATAEIKYLGSLHGRNIGIALRVNVVAIMTYVLR